MSPEEAMKNPWVNIAVNWLLSSLTLFIIFWFGLKDASAKKADKDLETKFELKADKRYVEQQFITKSEGATKLFVKEAIMTHEEKEAVWMEPIKQDLKDIKNYLFYNKMPGEN